MREPPCIYVVTGGALRAKILTEQKLGAISAMSRFPHYRPSTALSQAIARYRSARMDVERLETESGRAQQEVETARGAPRTLATGLGPGREKGATEGTAARQWDDEDEG